MSRCLFFIFILFFEHLIASVQINEPAPDFTLTDSHGDKISLSGFKGRTVILEWTNHGCPFVARHYDTGNMQEIQKTARNDNAVWISIISSAPGTQGYVSKEKANELTKQRKAFPSNILLDLKGTVGRRYGAKTTPHMYLIDKEGFLRYQGAIDDAGGRGFASKDLSKATNFVKKGLEEIKRNVSISSNTTKPYGCSIKYKSQ